jgi:hypothetical protein
VNNIFTGVNADLAVNDTDAWVYRLGYNITLIGRIVFIAPAIEWSPPQRPTVQPVKTS